MGSEKKYKRKKKLGSYPFFSVAFSITLALFVMGLFGLLLIATKSLTTMVQENVEMQVFLHHHLSQNEIVKIKKTLSAKDYVSKKEGVAQIVHITKKEAAQTFYQETGEDFMAFLGDNPLRDVITLKVHPDFHPAQNLREIKKEIGFIRGVYEVEYVESLVASIHQNVKKIGVVLMGLAVVFLLVVVVLINSTIKLALFSQRFLIRSMQLIGATTRFIRKPFLMRSVLFGVISSVIAIALLWGLLQLLEREVKGLLDLLPWQQVALLAAGLIVVGVLVGFFSTFVAMNKYLKMSLDELY